VILAVVVFPSYFLLVPTASFSFHPFFLHPLDAIGEEFGTNCSHSLHLVRTLLSSALPCPALSDRILS
jgi:hypothetical protein